MRVGILGSGLMGGKLWTLFAHAGMRWYSAMRAAKRNWALCKDPQDPTGSILHFRSLPALPEFPGHRRPLLARMKRTIARW